MNRPALFLVLVISLFVLSCDDDKPYQRSYRMGFQNSAPRIDNLDLFIQSLNLWTQRSDAAIISTEVPWEELLSGVDPVQYAINNYQGLVEFYRSKNLELWIYIDPQNGLDRTSDAIELQEAGKSIADADAQLLYRRFTVVMDSLFQPEHLGLALETNLIRDAASPAIYNGVKQAANAAFTDVHLWIDRHPVAQTDIPADTGPLVNRARLLPRRIEKIHYFRVGKIRIGDLQQIFTGRADVRRADNARGAGGCNIPCVFRVRHEGEIPVAGLVNARDRAHLRVGVALKRGADKQGNLSQSLFHNSRSAARVIF